ncbi:MAG: alpha-glucosidase/alpha-galactosidase, partial [Saccharofermentanales bacterium]
MKITFLGAGSTVFSKNVLGDCLVSPELDDYEIYLYDIDPVRLDDSFRMLGNINRNIGRNVRIVKTLDLDEALKGANYIVNAIQVGGYDPSTIADFEIPKKYGLKQTIADTLGIGGIMRTLRTVPVLEQFASSIHRNCPNALFINYTNPMAMLTGYMIEELSVNTVGLCHSVQVCVEGLLRSLGLKEKYLESCHQSIAGINHQSWLLGITDKDNNDLYPLIKQKSKELANSEGLRWDLVRHEMMHTFGYYNTESSEHTAEYNPYFIKKNYPELIERFNIPL